MRAIYRRLIHVMFVSIILISGFSFSSISSFAANQNQANEMEVHFIDVGQADATLITCDGHSMLIDTADDTKGTAIQSYLQNHGIAKLDYLVLTHPDSDHIGGAPVIITKFEIDNVFVSNYKKDDITYEKLIQALEYKYLEYLTPAVGSQYQLGTATITILAPCKSYDNPNDSSIALMIQNGDNKFLFTGDATESAEADILKSNPDVSADVYKAGHHGSKNSTSEEFFKAVNPKYAVVSCAEGNSFGHPHAQTLNTLRMHDVKVYRTDEEGTIIAISDGMSITFNVPASKTWKSGELSGTASDLKVEQTVKSNIVQESTAQETKSQNTSGITYVLNINTHKFHKPTCGSVKTIKNKNRRDSTDSRDTIINSGFSPCKKCKP